MDSELKQLLEENLRIAQENNDMLRSMRSSARWRLVWTIVFYAVIIIGPIWLLQAYLGPYMELLNGSTSSSTAEGMTGQLQNLLNQYQTK
jgi:hypothetical protein